MHKVIGCLTAVVTLALSFGAASAQNASGWDGIYAGIGVGGGSTKSCSTSKLTGPGIDSSTATFSSCPSGGTVGGIQIGDNFQTKRLVWGVGLDFDFSTSNTNNPALTSTGAAPPAGTYGSAGKFSPKDFVIVGGRIGYGGDLLFPYVRAGGVFTLGSQSGSVNYVPPGAPVPTASFSEGKSFASTGWVAGGGVEIGLNGAWSITAEYLRMTLGKGSTSTATCSGAAAACAPFAGISLDSTHDSFTTNIFRIGINYYFNYWDKP